jgi:hypothetical protein
MGKPSPTLDAIWAADYDLFTRVPQWQAEQMDVKGSEMPGAPGYHAVTLDIFHSLHCLNDLRMSLNSDYYGARHVRLNTTVLESEEHISGFLRLYLPSSVVVCC